MGPLCIICFSSLLLFFRLLYNSLFLTLSFFLLLHYLSCLLPDFISATISVFVVLLILYLTFVSVKFSQAVLFDSFFSSLFFASLFLESAFFSCLPSATHSCSMLSRSIFLLLSSVFCAFILLLYASLLLFFLRCFCSLLLLPS